MKFTRVLAAIVVVPVALLAVGTATGAQSEEDSTTTEAAAAEAVIYTMGTPPEGDTAELNIAQIAAGTAEVQTLTRMVILAGLLPTVRDGGPFTVFAPVNSAFAAIDPATLLSVQEDLATLTEVLTLHVVPGALSTDDLRAAAGTSLDTVAGGKLLVEVDGDDLIVGGAKVVLADVVAKNGVIHAVDTVITAPNG